MTDANNPMPIVFEAIVHKRCLTATYNRVAVTLAPHIVYTRHGDVHLDAVTLERDGKPPKEVKIGMFKLAGLSDVRLTERGFATNALFQAGDPKYEGETLMTVEV